MNDIEHLLQLVTAPDGQAEIDRRLAAAVPRNTRAYLASARGWEREAEQVGMLEGAQLLCTMPELRSAKFLPASPRKPGERIAPTQSFAVWVAVRALSWDQGAIDALDADLGNQALTETDRVEAVRLYRCRGVLAIVQAWRMSAPVEADRHEVPVTFKSPPSGGVNKPRTLAEIWARVEDMLDRALSDGADMGDASAENALRAGDMAAGRAQACREVLSWLPAFLAADDDPEPVFEGVRRYRAGDGRMEIDGRHGGGIAAEFEALGHRHRVVIALRDLDGEPCDTCDDLEMLVLIKLEDGHGVRPDHIQIMPITRQEAKHVR
jgi:hypothetical protein